MTSERFSPSTNQGLTDDDYRQLVAHRLALHRRIKGFSKRQLAELTGRSQAGVKRWELGDVPQALADLVRTCHVLGVTPNDVLLGSSADGTRAA